MKQTHSNTIIIGAGVCGVALGGFLQQESLILESGSSALRKLLASGGGRCNLTNDNLLKNRYLGDESYFDNLFSDFGTKDILALFKGIEFSKIRAQQYFAPSSKLILERMLKNCRSKILLNTPALSIKRSEQGWRIFTPHGEFSCANLIIATGSSAFKSLASSDFALKIAEQFNIAFKPFSPALNELIAQPQDAWLRELAGISLPASAQVANAPRLLEASLLFTHKGLGGPLAYNASLWWEKGAIKLNFAPHFNDWSAKSELATATKLPKRFATAILEHLKLAKKPLKNYSKDELERLKTGLCAYSFAPAGIASLQKAEIAKGGIETSALCKKGTHTKDGELLRGLYFGGECVNFCGELGGFNISAAIACARYLAKCIEQRV